MSRHTELARVRYVDLNGEHPMTAEDDAYVREHFVAADDTSLALMAAGTLPQASYLLGDGTPMVPSDHREPLERAGGHDRLEEWFRRWWPSPADAEQPWRDYLSGRCVHLTSVTPRTLREETRFCAQLAQGLDRMATDPRDPVGRQLVAEATGRLDGIYLPMCRHDRLRFGGTPTHPTPREERVERVREEWLAVPRLGLPLRTERLVLRAAVPEDWPAIHGWMSDPGVARFDLHVPHAIGESMDRARRFAEEPEPAGPDDKLALLVEHDGVVVGEILLALSDGTTGEIGWTVHPDHQGRGFATEAGRALLRVAFEEYALHRVYADLDGRNTASKRVCERIGMRREALLGQDFWSKGEFTDSYRYALLASEWPPASG